MDAKDVLLSLLAKARNSSDIKALLTLSSPGSLGEEAYAEFLSMVFGRGTRNEGEPVTRSLEKEELFAREEHAVNQFILEISKWDKVTIVGLQGAVAAPFFGASLVFDFRLASEDVVLSPSHANLGVPPGGALGFFLPHYVGVGRAVDMVFSGKPIPVSEAHEKGLVNDVLPGDRFEERCVERARELCRMPLAVARGTKALFYPNRGRELQEYLRREFDIMCQARFGSGRSRR